MQQTKEMDIVMIEMKEILKYITKDMYEKIPSTIKKLINNYYSENYKFKYDIDKELDEQMISEDTRNFIAYLHYNYWADEDGKKRIEKAWDENQAMIDKKYSYDNLFNKKIKEEAKEQSNINEHNKLILIKKEPWYKKILNKIKLLFGFNKEG